MTDTPKLQDENHIYAETVCDGRFDAMFRELLATMVRDGLDPNKVAKKKTVGSFSIEMVWNKDRTQCDISFVPSYKPSPRHGVESRFFVAIAPDGRIGISEFNPKQPLLPNLSLKPGETVTLSAVPNAETKEAQG